MLVTMSKQFVLCVYTQYVKLLYEKFFAYFKQLFVYMHIYTCIYGPLFFMSRYASAMQVVYRSSVSTTLHTVSR